MIQFPALIDCHVHFREPGFPHKATMQSEAASALAGGVRTVCEMPNTDPPTVTVAALADKVRRANEVNGVDIRFFFGVTAEPHLVVLRELWTSTSAELERLRARCCGVKLYLDHSTGNQRAEADIVEDVFRTCAELDIPLVAHCEDPETNAQAAAANTDTQVSAHSAMRPPEAETKAVGDALALAAKYGTPFHVAHLSTKEALEKVREAKAAGQNVSCEVAPHHLFLTVEDYESLGTLAKMNPPVRSREHQVALWAGIADGTVDCIATDHAPHTLEEKQSGEPLKAPSGVPGVETMLPLLLTVAAGGWPHPASERAAQAFTYDDIVRLCFGRPNEIFRLGKSDKPVLEIDEAAEWTIRAADLHSQCDWTPYEGWVVKGRLQK